MKYVLLLIYIFCTSWINIHTTFIWQKKNIITKDYKNILIIGISRGNNRFDRHSMVKKIVTELNKSKERYFIPKLIYFKPYISFEGRFWGYYPDLYLCIYTPAYYSK